MHKFQEQIELGKGGELVRTKALKLVVESNVLAFEWYHCTTKTSSLQAKIPQYPGSPTSLLYPCAARVFLSMQPR